MQGLKNLEKPEVKPPDEDFVLGGHEFFRWLDTAKRTLYGLWILLWLCIGVSGGAALLYYLQVLLKKYGFELPKWVVSFLYALDVGVFILVGIYTFVIQCSDLLSKFKEEMRPHLKEYLNWIALRHEATLLKKQADVAHAENSEKSV